MTKNSFIQIFHDWWPVVTAIIVISGFISSWLSYYARAEARDMIKVELIEPLKRMDEVTEKLEDQLKNIETQQIQNQTKIDMMIDLMKQNNKMLGDQNKSIEQLQK
jgi:uncharacterized membrane protein YhiD involved in acid resistance